MRIPLLALAVVFIAHWHVHVGYLRHLNTTHVLDQPIPVPVLVDVPAARRVVVLVLDGLGYDAGMRLPAIATLASNGASRVMVADFPSFTHPAITSMATGRAPRYSGVRINGPRPTLPWDSVSRGADAAGRKVWVFPDGWHNFAPLLLLPSGATVEPDGAVLDLQERGPELAWVYEGVVDKTSHRYGTRGADWVTAAHEADLRVATVSGVLDSSMDTLFVVSDHGHVPAGGHGGTEPEAMRALFVAWGHGIVQGARLPPAPMQDLAPTVSAALGLAPPAHSLGRAMRDVFGLEPDPASEGPPEAQAYSARFTRAARIRTAIAWLALSGLVAWLWRLGFRLQARDFLPLVVFAAIFWAGYKLLGYSITWSVPRSQLVYQIETALACFLGIAVAWRFASTKTRVTEETIAFVLVLGSAYVLASAWIGFDARWIAGPFASFLFLVIVTLLFYATLVWAIRALYATRKMTIRDTALLTGVSLFLFLAPFVIRFKLPM